MLQMTPYTVLLPIHLIIIESYIRTPVIFKMNKYEIDSSMDRIFDGAERVRAMKHKNRTKAISSRIMSQMWQEEKTSFQVA